MPVRRFCSACGEKLKAHRRTLFLSSLCARCAPRYRASRLARFGLLAFALFGSYFVGWLNHAQQSVNFIGTPLDPQSVNNYFANRQSIAGIAEPNPAAAQPAKPQEDETYTLCGAPTKAGHPCRRKVKGWGYCYQHRDKYGQKPLPPETKLEQQAQNRTN